MEFVDRIAKKKAAGRFNIEEDMEGIFTGRYVDNPFGTGDFPLWIASYVLADYGTGIVNCSAHDERDFAFAKKYDIPLKVVLLPQDEEKARKVLALEEFYREPNGILQQPLEFKGMRWDESRPHVIDYIEKKGYGKKAVNYKLRDWVFSRQRYWGEPIPMVDCGKCGFVPLPESELPLKLPEVERYQTSDTGESPLSLITDWVNVKCPSCGGAAKRETDTMPQWAGSSWYFLRYCDPHNDKELASREKLDFWTPVDWYNGGMEHTVLHLLYSRFWHKFLFDIGVVPTTEPYAKRTSHGMILGENHEKMSKSRGNVINPDDVVASHGADTLRLYEMFMGPFDQAIPWSTNGLMGMWRFLSRLWVLSDKIGTEKADKNILGLTHRAVHEVTERIEAMKFNTAISSLMTLSNSFGELDKIPQGAWEVFLKLLSPFAPHIAEEMWEQLGHKTLVSEQAWPKADPAYLINDTVTIAVQVNGKLRATITLARDLPVPEVEAAALADEGVKRALDNKAPKKVIVVPNRIVNVVA